MKKVVAFCLALVMGLVVLAGDVRLTIDGTAVTAESHCIVLPEEATAPEQWAAEELQRYLKKATGEELSIVSQAMELPSTKGIYLGRATGKADVDFQKLGNEGIHIESLDGELTLAGGQRGVLYAVYTFLEEWLDCHWYASDCIVVPGHGDFQVVNVRKVFVPPLEYRDVNYTYLVSDPVFYVPNKLNGASSISKEPRWGGNVSYGCFVHTMDILVPTAIYGKEHPEYYSLIDGKRVLVNTQLCLTNPEVLAIAIESLREIMRKYPQCAIFSVSQNDNFNYCRCEKCTALAEEEGSQAGPMLHFVNACADAVREEFPDKIIDTLAYQYTRKPPKHVKPAANVAVRLCSIECCFTHPLETCPFNKTFIDDIREWNKLTNRLHIWDYVINYAHTLQPFPNLRVLEDNVQFFVKHGVTGVFEEANYFSRGGELGELRTYLIAKCLWDPEVDWEAEKDAFVKAYYGPAAEQVNEYLELLHDMVCQKEDLHVGIYAAPDVYLENEAFLKRSMELFEQAEERVKEDPVLLRRVKLAKLSILYTKLAILSLSPYCLEGDSLVPTVTNQKDIALEYLDIVRQEGIERYAEGITANAAEFGEQALFRTAKHDVTVLENDRMKLWLLPTLGGRVWRAMDKATGKELLQFNYEDGKGYLLVPCQEGYEEFSSAGYNLADVQRPFQVLEIGADYAVMQAKFPNGATLTRRVELLAEKCAFQVTTKLTADTPKAGAVFRAHPVLSTPNGSKLSLHWKDASGAWQGRALQATDIPRIDGEFWMRDALRPAGIWCVANETDGTVIVNTFQNDCVDFCYANWNQVDNRVNLEEWSKPVDADAENGPVLQNTYELLPLSQAPWR
ncbi:MAG: DUF4838 domain-containing protein [Lentisphaeria bacterium]|nr:DUF4838 domain-containing protein [Lentisphaeria bacterium]